MRQALQNRKTLGVDLNKNAEVVREVELSFWTVRWSLWAANISSYHPAQCPKLLREHRVTGFQFAGNCASYALEDWNNVLLSDKARTTLCKEDRRRRVSEDHRNAIWKCISKKSFLMTETPLYFGQQLV